MRAERALDTLDISSVDHILVTQTPSGIAVTHLSGAGTHPEAGSFEYGSGGIAGDRIPPNTTWGVAHTSARRS